MKSEAKVKAAGCVVYRRPSAAPGSIEVLVVHRPKYHDWSLPKGKLEPDESFKQAAKREVVEETGMLGELGPKLSKKKYQVNGKSKVVRYWLMEATGGQFEPNEEVDTVKWLSPAEAVDVLSYPADAALITEAERILAQTSPHGDGESKPAKAKSAKAKSGKAKLTKAKADKKKRNKKNHDKGKHGMKTRDGQTSPEESSP